MTIVYGNSNHRCCKDQAMSTDAKTKLEASMQMLKVGKHESATQLIDEALSLKSDYVEAWLFKGLIFGKIGKYSEAQKCYDKAIELNPSYIEAWLVKGALYCTLNNHTEAIRCYDTVLEQKPDSTEAAIYKGYSLERLEKLDEAIQCYQKLMQQKPGEAKGWYALAVVYGNKGDYQEALKYFERALEAKEDYDKAIAGKSLMLIKLGRKDEANQFIQFISQKSQSENL